MKTYLLVTILAFLIPCQSAHSQYNTSTNRTQVHIWNPKLQKWDMVSDNPNENTLIVMNKQLTMVTHTTADKTSSYYIKRSVEDGDDTTYTYELVSDAGHKYTMIMDFHFKVVKFIGQTGEVKFMARHTMKNNWSD